MTKVEYLENIASRIKYKPNFKFRIWESGTQAAYEIILYCTDVPSVDNPRVMSQLVSRNTISYEALDHMINSGEQRHIFRVMIDMIKRMELHEIDEWLMIDGKRLVNPHPDMRDEDIWKL